MFILDAPVFVTPVDVFRRARVQKHHKNQHFCIFATSDQ